MRPQFYLYFGIINLTIVTDLLNYVSMDKKDGNFHLFAANKNLYQTSQTLEFHSPVNLMKYAYCKQWRSQNAEKVTHIKVRLPEQAMIFINCVPFQNRNFS